MIIQLLSSLIFGPVMKLSRCTYKRYIVLHISVSRTCIFRNLCTVTEVLFLVHFYRCLMSQSFSASQDQISGLRSCKYQLQCPIGNTTQITCSANNPKIFDTDDSSAQQCPEYFRWIYKDLRPWERTGITKEIFESMTDKMNLRILVIDGNLYLEK